MTSVCIITSVHTPYDTRIFYRQALTLREAGHEVTILAHHNRSENRRGIRIESVGKAATRPERWSHLPRIYRRALQLDADIYHFHDPELIPVGLSLRYRTNAKVIYDVHEDYVDAINAREWLPDVTTPCIKRVFPRIQLVAAERFDVVITADKPTADEFIRRGVSSPVVPLRNFPRISDISFTNVDPPSEHESILAYVGGLDRERGILKMLDLLRRLNHRHDVGLWLIGSFGEKSVKEEATRFVENHQLAKDVEFLGRVEYPRFFSYLSLADIGLAIVDPDRFANNVPTKLFEYMCCGLPIVTVDAEGVRRYVDEAGITVPWQDSEQQAAAVEKLLTDIDRRSKMGEIGEKKVAETYNWEEESDKLIEIYELLQDTDDCHSLARTSVR